jgi:hypothetical protein
MSEFGRVFLAHLLEYCAASDADADEDEDVSTLEELASVLVPHHRKEAVRMCAVQCPLSGARLRTRHAFG